MPVKRPPTPPVEDLAVSPTTSVAELVDAFARMGGFTSRKVAQAVDVLRRMRADDARVVLTIPAAPFATGLRGVVVDLVKAGYVHAIVTTCGTLDHDLARLWGSYHHGEFELDDAELHERGYHRLGNVLVPQEAYGPTLEEKVRPILRDVFADEKRLATHAFCRAVGRALDEEAGKEATLLWQAAKHDVPIFVPGPTDGAVGSQVWMAYQQDRTIGFDLLADEQALSDLVSDAEKLGGLIVGGGISKHHLIWWAQFRDGLDYAVAVTTAVEHDGSLSGARLREAISWGKLKEGADHVTVEADATLVLPLVAAGWMADAD